MESHLTKKQIIDTLNEFKVSIVDHETGDQFPVEILLNFVLLKITKQEFKILIDSIRFEKQINDFILETNNKEKDLEFYAQHYKEINKEKDKTKVFQRKFNVVDFEEFKAKFKNKNWYLPSFYEEELRKEILEAQNGKCSLCSKDVKNINPHLHHIDYNKQNCLRRNLTFLCPRCHGKTNSNREFWKSLLVERQNDFIT